MVRCAVCRKGVLSRDTVYSRSGEPGGKFIRDLLDCNLEFPCGHLIDDHKLVEKTVEGNRAQIAKIEGL